MCIIHIQSDPQTAAVDVDAAEAPKSHQRVEVLRGEKKTDLPKGFSSFCQLTKKAIFNVSLTDNWQDWHRYAVNWPNVNKQVRIRLCLLSTKKKRSTMAA